MIRAATITDEDLRQLRTTIGLSNMPNCFLRSAVVLGLVERIQRAELELAELRRLRHTNAVTFEFDDDLLRAVEDVRSGYLDASPGLVDRLLSAALERREVKGAT